MVIYLETPFTGIAPKPSVEKALTLSVVELSARTKPR
jgi:hypothetical protein